MPPSEFWTVPRDWAGATAFLIGGGPSLRGFDPERLRGRRVIVVNRMVLAKGEWPGVPWADVLYFCDWPWWLRDGAEVAQTFTGRYIVTTAVKAIGQHPLIRRIRNTGTAGLELDPTGVKHGTNSGYQAINLAFHFGVRRIVLLGYDMKTDGQVTHAHGGYGLSVGAMENTLQTRMLPYFSRLVKPLRDRGVEVLNASPESAIDHWPKISLDEAVTLGD